MQRQSHDELPDGSASSLQAAAPRTVNRRALLRAGAAAAPVVLTLASTPVSATTGTCTVASSFVSVATFKSRNPNAVAQCSTRTCESWRTESCTPTAPYYSQMGANSITALLGSTTPASSRCNNSITSVMCEGSGIATTGELGVMQHLATLCMNVMSGNASVPGNVTQTYIQGIWKNYKSNGDRYILSSSGINWDSAQLVTWVRMLVYPSV